MSDNRSLPAGLAVAPLLERSAPVGADETAPPFRDLTNVAHDFDAGIYFLINRARAGSSPVVFVIDADGTVCETLKVALEKKGITVRCHATCENFLRAYRPGRDACLLVDACAPGIGGLGLIARLAELGHPLPVIMLTGNKDTSIVVNAMKAGVSEFIEKPLGFTDLLASVHRAIARSQNSNMLLAKRKAAAFRIGGLTPRQRQVMTMILNGTPNKNIASDLRVSQRTVESHRASIMRKTGSHSLPELTRLAIAAI